MQLDSPLPLAALDSPLSLAGLELLGAVLLVSRSGKPEARTVSHFEGDRGAEHLVCLEVPYDSVGHYEGEKGAEHIVRLEALSGDVSHYEGEKGAEHLVRFEASSGMVCHFKGEKGAERVVRREGPSGTVSHFEGEKKAERAVRCELPSSEVRHFEGEQGAERLVRSELPYGGLVHHYEGEKGVEQLVSLELPYGGMIDVVPPALIREIVSQPIDALLERVILLGTLLAVRLYLGHLFSTCELKDDTSDEMRRGPLYPVYCFLTWMANGVFKAKGRQITNGVRAPGSWHTDILGEAAQLGIPTFMYPSAALATALSLLGNASRDRRVALTQAYTTHCHRPRIPMLPHPRPHAHSHPTLAASLTPTPADAAGEGR